MNKINNKKIIVIQSVIVSIVALVYLISPIDIIPDGFLGLGQMDDVAVITLAVVNAVRAYNAHKQSKTENPKKKKSDSDAIEVEARVLNDE